MPLATNDVDAQGADRRKAWLQYIQAVLYLMAVGAVFVGGYQLTLRHASHHISETPIVDTWIWLDAWVPLWPWSIVVYCSLDLVYAAAFFICSEPRALRQLSIRLLLVQGLAFVSFWLFAFRMQRSLPVLEGLPALLYQWLASFDQPGNLLPSLHVAVLGVLWWTLRSYVGAPYRRAWHAWAVAVCVSTLTTWQHHVLDVVAGGLLAWLVLWATWWRGRP